MRRTVLAVLGLAAVLAAPQALAQGVPIPQAVIADPPADPKAPARMEVVHIPTGGVKINGVVLVAAGAGPHPAFVLFHGLPGNEKNLDLAQAVRRAGWTVVTLNYRGSWGSPGTFSFGQNLEDAEAALAFIRDPANAAKLGIDPSRIALGGHSMGGWVTAEILAREPGLLGGVVISPGDMGGVGILARTARAQVVANMDDNRETLAGATGESMTDELAAHGPEWSFATLAPKLKDRRLLVLYGDDFVKASAESLIAGVKAAGGTRVEAVHVATDHSWSDRRITLEALVINWLATLPARP